MRRSTNVKDVWTYIPPIPSNSSLFHHVHDNAQILWNDNRYASPFPTCTRDYSGTFGKRIGRGVQSCNVESV
jgi:hypothetical protein